VIKKLFIPLLLIISFFYRLSGICISHPLWVDEYSSAYQARMVLENGLSVFKQIDFEHQNILTHFLVAFSYKAFGISVNTTRLPFLIIGSMVPILVYFLAQEIWERKSVSISSSLLTAFSYIQITWSLQARGYVIQQALFLLCTLLIIKIKKRKWKSKYLLVLFVLSFTLGILTHASFLILLLSFGTYFFVSTRNKKLKNFYLPIFSILFLIGVMIFTNVGSGVLTYVANAISSGFSNNVWYYHSFLWRNYSLFVLLSLIAGLQLIKKSDKYKILLLMPIFLYLVLYSFVHSPYSSRYLLNIFPIMYILSSYLLDQVGRKVVNLKFFGILITIFIIINGNKFVLIPKKYYSINHDMREIAIVDYDKVYAHINTLITSTNQPVAIIDTWHDRLRWYRGKDYLGSYLFRWKKNENKINGLSLKTEYEVDSHGQKYSNSLINILLVMEESDIKLIQQKYKHGVIIIDDSSLPKDVINYVENNFREELIENHYIYEDDPYSIWPLKLYSWGFS